MTTIVLNLSHICLCAEMLAR